MTTTASQQEEFGDRIHELHTLLTSLAKTDAVSTMLGAHLVESSLADAARLVSGGRYVVGGSQRIFGVMDRLFGLSQVSAVDVVSNLGEADEKLWRVRELFHKLIDLTTHAARRGVVARYALVVDDYLRFAMDERQFAFAKDLSRGGTAVRIVERRGGLGDLNGETMVLSSSTGPLASATVSGETGTDEFLSLSVRVSHHDVSQYSFAFRAVWDSAAAVPLRRL